MIREVGTALWGAEFRGQVIDASNGEPVANATLTLDADPAAQDEQLGGHDQERSHDQPESQRKAERSTPIHRMAFGSADPGPEVYRQPASPLYGVEGVGEPLMGCAAAALLCAVSDALGGHYFNRNPIATDMIVNAAANRAPSQGPLAVNSQ